MGFFRKDDAPRWVDEADLGWTPEEPLAHAPRFGAAADFAAPPRAVPTPEASEPWRFTLPAPSRLAIGVAQGFGLYLLVQARAHGVWPGNDPYLFAALSLAGLFAPLVLLEGLGEIPLPLLALWTGAVAAGMAYLGIYHHWRIQGPEQIHAGLGLALAAALMLVIAQALLRATVKDRRPLPEYRTAFHVTWTLLARLTVWAMITGLAWSVLGWGDSLLNALRAHYPNLHIAIEPALLTLPLVALASAAAFDMTAANGSASKRFMRKALLACWTIALPPLVAVSALVLMSHLTAMPVPLAWLTGLAVMLVIGINASYRGEIRRGRWRKISEAVASFLIAALAIVSAIALHSRVAQLGWTAPRIEMAVAIVMVGLYGALYAAAALISLGGGRWMQRIELVNLGLAPLLFLACVALSTPLADPLRLAVQAQSHRLASGAVDPALFDFDWLRRDGVRFGQQALAGMVRAPSPEIARDAAIALATPPDSETPPPSEIGANITLRTSGARLPNTLLAQDWGAKGDAVPPCLTKPRLACDAWSMDMDHDGRPEFLLVYGTDARWWASVLKERGGQWNAVASFASPPCRGTLTAMRKGNLYAVEPAPTWQDLFVAGFRLTAKPAPRADLPCPKPY